METLERFLQVSPKNRKLFTVDLQNDCACAIETYEVEPCTFYWDEGQVKTCHIHRLELPMQPGVLTDEILISLGLASGMTEREVQALDMFSFGVIAANLAGWGAFCFGSRLKKH